MKPQANKLFRQNNRRSVIIGGVVTLFIGSLPAIAAETTITATKAYAAAKAGEIILVDIRSPQEWEQTGIGAGAIGIDMRTKLFVERLTMLRSDNPDTPIALICRSGNRSGYIFDTLSKRGFKNLRNVSEGMSGGPNGKGWIARGLPTYSPSGS